MAFVTPLKYIGGMATALLLLAACAPTESTETTEKVMDLQTMSTSFYQGDVRSHDVKARLDAELAQLPKVEAGEESVAVSEELTQLLSTYLDASHVNANRYDELLGVLYNDILLLASDKDTLAVADVAALEDGAVKGFWQDIDQLGLKVVFDKSISSHFVQVDYDKFEEAYGTYLNAFQANNIRLQRHIQGKNFYDLAKGVPDFENIHDRLLLIEEIQDGDKSKDNYYWEGERYFYYSGLLGFNEATMVDDTGNISNDAAGNMLAFIENNPDSPYVKDVTEVFEAIEKTVTYGADAVTIANRLINERFQDYITHVSESANETLDSEAKASSEEAATLEGDTADVSASGTVASEETEEPTDEKKEEKE